MRWPARPAEGWFAVALVAVMALAIGLSLDDPGWVLGNKEWTDFLPFAALAGVAAGFLGAKMHWPLWLAHLAGAVVAALVLPVVVGWIQDPDASPVRAFTLTADAVVQAWIDLAIRRNAVTGQTLHHLLAFGVLAWGTGQAMSYAVFGHRRPLDAVVVGGLVLIVNLTSTGSDHLRFLVLFTASALFLLVMMHALDERLTWIRRRIGDPSTISQLYLRGGAVFIAVAIVGSLVLTDKASSAPLQGAMSGASRFLFDISEQIQGFLPAGGDQRPGAVSFKGRSQVNGKWFESDEVAFTAELPRTFVNRDAYYVAGAWDTFIFPNTWDQSRTDRGEITVASGDSVADLLPDRPDPTKSREVEVRIVPASYPDPIALGLGTISSVDRDTALITLGERPSFMAVRVDQGAYTATSIIWDKGNDDLNQAALRNASEEYPQEIRDLYLGGWQQAIPAGGAAEQLRDRIAAGARSRDPFDLAKAFEDAFRNTDEFTYDADVRDLQCDTVGLVECLAKYRQGYCMHYATSMALMLRSLGVPTRVMQGFLRGDRDPQTSIETVRNSSAHAWVEVYFPGWGWHTFDPTGGLSSSQAQGGALVPGPSAPAGPRTPAPSSSIRDRETVRPSINEPGENFGPLGRPQPTNTAMLILVTVLLVVIVGGFAAAAWWRGPRGEVTPDLAWRTVGRLASRFGFAPRPTQTVYEYAGALGDVIPVAREDLSTVARAKVEVVYGKTRLTDDRLRGLREANRRLRVTLLRLVLRRPRRRGPRGLRR